MRRILSLVVVALVMAAMVLVVAMPALTDAKDKNDGSKCSVPRWTGGICLPMMDL